MYCTRQITMLNRNILMPLLGAASLLLSWPVLADSEDKSIPSQEQVIQPQLERREVKVPHITPMTSRWASTREF